jgi:putative FmdB family regulatory protein
MPLYEYECSQCHKHTEKIQKFSDAEITTCPHCGGPLERVISAPAISFKGGGWFKDGYGNAKPAASGGGEGKSDSGSASGASSDSAAPAKSDGAQAVASTSSVPATASAPAAPVSDKK